ncbi:hypothetical protein HME9304_00684 [Flagellimonas maritima]|uniref:Uncharacterized protein n=1 Tax=Flagellimonas maritima TaxID=1383885 RepID=A0A2Z4LPJ2_9FLAO|nr:hypothetical protein HME9304_00684 [Allomuricauda aurantiaca]
MRCRKFFQYIRRLFRRYIALRVGEHLIGDHELLYRCRLQQGRIEGHVEMPFGMSDTVRRRLMDAHGVGKRSPKKIVVSGCHVFDDLCKTRLFIVIELTNVRQMSFWGNHSLVWPNGPVGHHRNKMVILKEHPFHAL